MRRIGSWVLLFALVALVATVPPVAAQRTQPLDRRSGFYSFAQFQEAIPSGTGGPGRGTIAGLACTLTTAGAPADFAGNFLLNCDSPGPHNETTIAVNPLNANNVIAGSHSYLLTQVGGVINFHVIANAYVTTDGGATWNNVHPPLGSYQFTGDPVMAFDSDGRAYYFNIADHEGQGGPFTNVSVIAQRSDDGGMTWTSPATVARGRGAIANGPLGMVIFNDKEWGTADANAASPFRNRVYVTWTRFLYEHNAYIESPIWESHSDNGRTWSAPQEISGSSATLCSAQIDTRGGAFRCDENQFSQPVAASDGTVYVTFLNEQYVGDGQFRDRVLMVKSTDGGVTWSNPVAVTPIINDGVSDYPLNSDGRQRLSGCAYRVNSAGALAVHATNANRLYYVYTNNTTPGSAGPTQTDIMAVTSADGGANWTAPVAVNSSTADQVYPWAVVGADGRLRVGYNDHDLSLAPRAPVAGQTCVYGYTLSTATVADSVGAFTHAAIETGLSIASFSRWFSVNTRFIGDYTNIARSPSGAIWSAWTDMRQLTTAFGITRRDQDAVAEVTGP